MLNQDELDKLVIEAKKQLTAEQIKEAIRKTSYGGRAIGIDLKRPLDCMGISLKGGENIYGKTNA